MECENTEHWFRASDYCKEKGLSPFDAELWNKALEATKSGPKVEWKFPCYGACTNNELVVYFDRPGEGKIVKSGDIGWFHNRWDMSLFTPCTLEAKEIKCW